MCEMIVLYPNCYLLPPSGFCFSCFYDHSVMIVCGTTGFPPSRLSLEPNGHRHQTYITAVPSLPVKLAPMHMQRTMLGCWLQVAGVLVTYWLPGYLLLVTGLLVTWLSGYYLLPGRRKNQFPIAYEMTNSENKCFPSLL